MAGAALAQGYQPYRGFFPNPYYDGPVAMLEELYVAPSHRGRGLGTHLVAETVAATRTVFARARAERDAHMAWVQRTAPLLAAEVGADPRATFAALDRMMREHLEYLADMPLGSFGDGA